MLMRQIQPSRDQSSNLPVESISANSERFLFRTSWQCIERNSCKVSNARQLKENTRVLNPLSVLSGKENGRRSNPLDELTLSLGSLRNNWGQRLPFTSPSLSSPTFSDCLTPQSSPEKLSGQLDSNKPRYKTELCKRFEACKKCEYSSKCQYAHGTDELRLPSRHPKYKSQLCEQYHENGTCLYGRRCDFIHSETAERLAEIRYHIHLYHRFREAFPDKAKDVTIRMLLDHAKMFPETTLNSVQYQHQNATALQQIRFNDIASELLHRQQQQLRSALAASSLSLNCWGFLDSTMLP